MCETLWNHQPDVFENIFFKSGLDHGDDLQYHWPSIWNR
jgi:hypothetical protein